MDELAVSRAVLKSPTIDWLMVASVLVCIFSVVFVGTLIVEVVRGTLH